MRYIDEDVYPWGDAFNTANEFAQMRQEKADKELKGSAHATGPKGAAARAVGCSNAC